MFVRPMYPDQPEKNPDPRLSRCREIPPEAVGGGIFDGFFLDNFRPEVDSQVISGLIVDPTGMKVPVKLGDSRLNRSRDT